MEEKKNKLKQLLDSSQDLFANTRDAWDIPDAQVWDSARPHFPNYSNNLDMEAQAEARRIYQIGIALTGLSFLFFFLSGEIFTSQLFDVSFIVCYVIFIVYFIILGCHNSTTHKKIFAFKNLSHTLILAVLGTISAYSLNRFIPVFHESTAWLSWFLLISNVSFLWISHRKFNSPIWVNNSIMFVLGANFILQLYQSIYTLPVMLYTIPTFWFFGISLHAFIPLWSFILTIKLAQKAIKRQRFLLPVFISGMAMPVCLLGLFIVQWSKINQTITDNWEAAQIPRTETLLPAWTRVAQRIEPDYVTERILKSGWKYTTMTRFFGGGLSMNSGRREHDPFVFIASIVGGKLDINDREKSLIYRSITNERHTSERRLWTGDDLITKEIATNVQLMPEYRIAYTEKNFKIKNDYEPQPNNWRHTRTQEAIYTFYLPEGSVVTSASLWIEGEERPAILTTKAKAENAYNTIVGRERRDPLLVTWQEGNRISARIFPCTVKEDREFKIGVTSPLLLKDNKLVYQNIDFQGPYFAGAKERINVIVEGESVALESDLDFEIQPNGYVYDGDYKSDWELNFPAPALSNQPFVFDNRAFSLQEYQPQFETFTPSEIYLDINQSWTKNNYEQLLDRLKSKKIYVWSGKLLEVTATNKDVIFAELSTLKFSIFPFQKIQNPTQSLVISASGANTPTLSELRDKGGWRTWSPNFSEKNQSKFSKGLNAALQSQTEPYKVFHFGENITPYLKTLQELRRVNLETGGLDELSQLVDNQKFLMNIENDNQVVLPQSNLILKEAETTATASTDVPDHLMRLFVYNDLMRDVGKDYFDKDQNQDKFIDAASEVTIISPVSSFVTLETQKDYDRFEIEKNKNGLQNATFDSAGSVPEPHEWLMIILVAAFMFWMQFLGFKKPQNGAA